MEDIHDEFLGDSFNPFEDVILSEASSFNPDDFLKDVDLFDATDSFTPMQTTLLHEEYPQQNIFNNNTCTPSSTINYNDFSQSEEVSTIDFQPIVYLDSQSEI